MLVDYSPTTHELLVAVILYTSAGQVRTISTRLPAPGARRGVLVGTPGNGPYLPASRSSYEYVQFFDDTSTFETFQIVPPTGDQFSPSAAFDISLVASGEWPGRVTDASFWIEGLTEESSSNLAYTDPYPTAVVMDTGDVFIWQFDRSPGPEDFLTPFGHVPPGSRLMLVYGACDPRGLLVLSPDGEQHGLWDGDNDNVMSPALLPAVAPATPAWSSAAVLQGFLDYFAADSVIYWLF